MPFQFTEEERLVAQTVREFARRITLDNAADSDRHDRVPEEVLQEAASLGLFGMALRQDGVPANPTAFAATVHELAQIDPNAATILAVQNTVVRLLDLAKSPLAEQVAQGGLASLLVTEEAHGSDVGAAGTTAVPQGGGYLLTGQKVWGIAAAVAKTHIVLARVPGVGPTLFAVPADTPGIVLSANEPLLGLRASGIRTVYISKAKVGADSVLGEAGKGMELLAQARPWLQVGAAAALAGCMAGALEAAARFAETRVQFGQPIGSYQAVSDAVTQMDVQLAATRALCFEAASHLEEPDAGVWAARAKTFAAEAALAATRQAIRVQGGTGFMREGGTERFARDARALQFVGETTQMQRDTLRRVVMGAIEFPAAP